MSQLLETAIDAARIAAEHILLAHAEVGSLQVEEKARFDYVSRVDRESEALIRERILQSFPNDPIFGEEYGGDASFMQAKRVWIVDPLDGTTNFLKGIPHYAVSIAVMQSGVLTHGVVLDPIKQELFSAQRGGGAYLNDQCLPPLEKPASAGALYATGIPFNGQNLAEVEAFSNTMQRLLELGSSGVRRLGSAALDLAYVAAGRYDGYWEANLAPWDMAAGVLLVREAQGKVGSFSGAEDVFTRGDIVAAPQALFERIVQVTAANYSRPE